MRTELVTIGSRTLRNSVLPWVLTAAREARAALAGAARAALQLTFAVSADAPMWPYATFLGATHIQDSNRLDATAGCEFVDDEIRHVD